MGNSVRNRWAVIVAMLVDVRLDLREIGRLLIVGELFKLNRPTRHVVVLSIRIRIRSWSASRLAIGDSDIRSNGMSMNRTAYPDVIGGTRLGCRSAVSVEICRTIQRNALESWTVAGLAQIVVGDESLVVQGSLLKDHVST